MAPVSEPIPAERLTVVPANEASWDDLAAIFGTTDYPGRCQCQRFKILGWIWRDSTQEERTAMLRAQTACGDPNAAATSGLVAYVDDEPGGWVAVEPRTAYPKLRTSRVPWGGRDEDKGDDGIWAVTCFVVQKGYRGRGLTYPLGRATIDFAGERGARARGLPDDHPAGQGDHLGRSARGRPSGLRGRRVRGGQPPHASARGHADRLRPRGNVRQRT